MEDRAVSDKMIQYKWKIEQFQIKLFNINGR